MTRTKLLAIAALVLFFSACKTKNPVSIEQEQAVVEVMYQCLDLSPNQWDAKMSSVGLQLISDMEVFKTYSTIDIYSDSYQESELLLVNIFYPNNIIKSVSYGRSLNHEKNPVAHFKLISDKIASHGYSNWKGTYKDASTGYTAQIAKDRSDLFAHINNDYLSDAKTTQSYSETFIYTHTDGSRWNGSFDISGNVYGSKGESISGSEKEVNLNFRLERIQ